jgi:hypothetical protein
MLHIHHGLHLLAIVGPRLDWYIPGSQSIQTGVVSRTLAIIVNVSVGVLLKGTDGSR